MCITVLPSYSTTISELRNLPVYYGYMMLVCIPCSANDADYNQTQNIEHSLSGYVIPLLCCRGMHRIRYRFIHIGIYINSVIGNRDFFKLYAYALDYYSIHIGTNLYIDIVMKRKFDKSTYSRLSFSGYI